MLLHQTQRQQHRKTTLENNIKLKIKKEVSEAGRIAAATLKAQNERDWDFTLP